MMKGIVPNNLLSFMAGAAWLLLMPALAVAQSDAQTKSESSQGLQLEETVVTASRVKELLKTAPDAVTVVTEKEIKEKGQQTLVEVLNDIPGIVVNQYGVNGGAEYLYMRGSDSSRIVYLIDGVPVKNPGSTGNAISISGMPADSIERIEVVRGNQSVLYGSNAMGGVINIITKKGKGKPQVNFGFEGGSYESFKENLGLQGDVGRIDYNVQATRFDTGGPSKADTSAPQERDYYNSTNITAKVNASLSDKTRVGATVYQLLYKMDYDDSPTAAHKYDGIGTEGYGVLRSDQTFLSAYMEQEVTKWWISNLKVGNADTKNEYYGDTVPATQTSQRFLYNYIGNAKTASWQNDFFLGDRDTLTAGLEYLHETGGFQQGQTFITDKEARTGSAFIQNKWLPVKNADITVGMRYDHHQTFGEANTYKVAGSYLFERIGTKIRATYGTGFRAPSVLQLYYPVYGNLNLQPEKSKGYDFGIDQSLFKDKVTLSVTYFRNDLENMIGTAVVGGITQFYNVGFAKYTGLETSASWRPLDWISLNVHYTYQDARNEQTQDILAHVPHHTGGASFNLRPWKPLNWNVSAEYMGQRNAASLSGIVPVVESQLIFNTAASYDVNKWLQLTARVTNFTNLHYQTMYGYAGPGIAVYGGFNVKL